MPEITIKVLKPGTRVRDDLTGKIHVIVGVRTGLGWNGKTRHPDDFAVTGYWIDSEYLGGGRHPWEIEEVKEK